MPFHSIDTRQAYEIALDTQMREPRRATGPEDWGDQDTVWLQTKHVGATPFSPPEHFGMYLGHHEDIGYVIAIKDLNCNITGGEVFPTIEEMKQRWELD